jgi:uncharacterized protein (TIGR02147 family)
MSVFNYSDYKKFVREWVEARPKSGRGEFRRMAQHLRVSSTMISQVFNGGKDLNLEMASELAEFLGLNEKEERFLFLLIDFARAGSHKLKSKLRKQIEEVQKEAQKVAERVAKHKELSNEEKAIYYSSWTYTGVRNLLAIEREWTLTEVAAQLKLPESQVREVIQFLTDHGLLQLEDGRYKILAKATHIGADSPLVVKHHQNWRIRGFQKMDLRDANHLYYTGPMSLSVEDSGAVRQKLLDLIQSVNRLVVDSPSETVRCLNLDWFEY